MEDLSGLLEGELDCRPATCAVYASDASIYQITPLGVAWPRNTADVITLAKYAADTDTPLFPRGAGTGLAGQAIGDGIIVDFSRHMNRLISTDGNTVRVQPGIVRDKLNEQLRESGRYFPPDPSNTAITTIGGMCGVDAAGSRSVRVGSMRDHVASLEMVLAGGECIEWGRETLELLRAVSPQPADVSREDSQGQIVLAELQSKRNIVSKLAKILEDNAELIRQKQPPLPRNCSGYYLRNILDGESLHIPRMLVGSEGTLGLFTELTLYTAPRPAHRGVVLLLFGQLAAAIRTVQAISDSQPSACDLLDRRLLSLAREADPRFAELISPAAEAALLIEHVGLSDRQVRERVSQALDAVHAVNLRAIVAHEAYSPDEAGVDFLWSLPSRVVPLLTRLQGKTRPVPFIEDVAVPPESLFEFITVAQRVLQKHEVTATIYAHAAAGQVHLRPFLSTPTPADGQKLEALARDIYQAVFGFGGTISGEHGDGLSRTAFLRSQYGSLYRVFREIKDLFDPHNLLNPGKIVSDDPHLTLKNIRPVTNAAPETVELHLNWDAAEFESAATRCNGCGTCRTQTPTLRMCPFFREDQNELASPRAKANLSRERLQAAAQGRPFEADALRQVTKLCFNCKQCELECPANVNIPQMVTEARAADVAANGLKRTDWVLSRAHSFGAFGSAAWLPANWAIRNKAARWMIERLFGISRKRKLPMFARRPFLRSMHADCRRPPALFEKQRTVVYFVSEYANFYDPDIAHALVAVFRHNGYRVYVPDEQTTSGMAMVTAGDLEAARDVAEKNVRVMAELAREGYPIVCSEPSAAIALRKEYPMILDHPDVQTVADRVIDAGQFLGELHQQGRMKTEFQPLNVKVGYHTPCHLKSLTGESALAQLLALIPGVDVHTIDAGCSGMAGAFGLSRGNFETSIRMGWPLISRMRGDDLNIGATECSSCKMQMEQGTSTPTLHPLKLLALAYGLMPELRKKLEPTNSRLTVS